MQCRRSMSRCLHNLISARNMSGNVDGLCHVVYITWCPHEICHAMYTVYVTLSTSLDFSTKDVMHCRRSMSRCLHNLISARNMSCHVDGLCHVVYTTWFPHERCHAMYTVYVTLSTSLDFRTKDVMQCRRSVSRCRSTQLDFCTKDVMQCRRSMSRCLRHLISARNREHLRIRRNIWTMKCLGPTYWQSNAIGIFTFQNNHVYTYNTLLQGSRMASSASLWPL